jgi:exodeoxyribonuclease III
MDSGESEGGRRPADVTPHRAAPSSVGYPRADHANACSSITIPTVRLLTWNVAGRVARQPEQAAAVAGAGADVVALQEVTARTLPLWLAALRDAGLACAETALAGLPAGTGRRRPLGVLTAAREPLRRLPPPPGVPWAERVLCCAVGDVEVVNLHSPIAPAPDLAKVRTHEAVAAYLAAAPPGPRVLCGDLNTPRRELPDGDVLTFAHDSAGRLRPERGERWDSAERALVHDLRSRGWIDAFRALHGYGAREASWTFARDRGGWRLDHVLVHGLEPVACAYAHDWRRLGLSDHSALIADLTPSDGP